jgi:hypothetical protein
MIMSRGCSGSVVLVVVAMMKNRVVVGCCSDGSDAARQCGLRWIHLLKSFCRILASLLEGSIEKRFISDVLPEPPRYGFLYIAEAPLRRHVSSLELATAPRTSGIDEMN